MGLKLFVCLTLISALGVVYVRHQNRAAYVELQAQIDTRDRLNVQWTQLLLEQATLLAPHRVDHNAQTELEMVAPAPEAIVTLRLN